VRDKLDTMQSPYPMQMQAVPAVSVRKPKAKDPKPPKAKESKKRRKPDMDENSPEAGSPPKKSNASPKAPPRKRSKILDAVFLTNFIGWAIKGGHVNVKDVIGVLSLPKSLANVFDAVVDIVDKVDDSSCAPSLTSIDHNLKTGISTSVTSENVVRIPKVFEAATKYAYHILMDATTRRDPAAFKSEMTNVVELITMELITMEASEDHA